MTMSDTHGLEALQSLSSRPAADRHKATIAFATGLRSTAAMPGRASIRDEICGAANSVTEPLILR